MPLILNGSTGISGTDGSAGTPALQGTDTNTGIYFPGADRIGFAEGGVQVGEFDASGNFQFNSGYGSVATAFGCRAWVNFNGTGTVAIRASGNVSSITDAGVGAYLVNLSTAMPDANYSVVAVCSPNVGLNPAFLYVDNTAQSSSTFNVTVTWNSSGASWPNVDVAFVGAAIFR